MRNYGLFVGSMMVVVLLLCGVEVVFGQDFDPNTVNESLVVRVVSIDKTNPDNDVIEVVDGSDQLWGFYATKDHTIELTDTLIIIVENGRVIGAHFN